MTVTFGCKNVSHGKFEQQLVVKIDKREVILFKFMDTFDFYLLSPVCLKLFFFPFTECFWRVDKANAFLNKRSAVWRVIYQDWKRWGHDMIIILGRDLKQTRDWLELSIVIVNRSMMVLTCHYLSVFEVTLQTSNVSIIVLFR